MVLFSYVVARDYGFAPNPFHGYCTLATCKPIVRRVADVGDWILGTGSQTRKRKGHAVFLMRVTEVLTFERYWEDPRFRVKRPDLRGSKKQAFGDNIYHRDPSGGWLQENSHHTLSDGSANPLNVANDTKTNRVLVSDDFVYWGGSGPKLPRRFREYQGADICAIRGHNNHFPEHLVNDFTAWVAGRGAEGFAGAPLDWVRTP